MSAVPYGWALVGTLLALWSIGVAWVATLAVRHLMAIRRHERAMRAAAMAAHIGPAPAGGRHGEDSIGWYRVGADYWPVIGRDRIRSLLDD